MCGGIQYTDKANKIWKVYFPNPKAALPILKKDGEIEDTTRQLGVGRARYAQSRLTGIERDLPRAAPPVKVDVARLVELSTQAKPVAATH